MQKEQQQNLSEFDVRRGVGNTNALTNVKIFSFSSYEQNIYVYVTRRRLTIIIEPSSDEVSLYTRRSTSWLTLRTKPHACSERLAFPAFSTISDNYCLEFNATKNKIIQDFSEATRLSVEKIIEFLELIAGGLIFEITDGIFESLSHLKPYILFGLLYVVSLDEIFINYMYLHYNFFLVFNENVVVFKCKKKTSQRNLFRSNPLWNLHRYTPE